MSQVIAQLGDIPIYEDVVLGRSQVTSMCVSPKSGFLARYSSFCGSHNIQNDLHNHC